MCADYDESVERAEASRTYARDHVDYGVVKEVMLLISAEIYACGSEVGGIASAGVTGPRRVSPNSVKPEPAMALSFQYLVPVSVGAVMLVLLAGLWNMFRGQNANLSQKLMRWRVGLQFVAIVIIMIAIYLKQGT